MNEGLTAVNQRADDSAKESAMMPDMSALTNMAAGMHKMGLSQKERSVNLLAAKLGVEAQPGDKLLSPQSLSQVMITRAQAAGRSEAEI
tara:strand:+ start:1797 stop:2063 length:267 start_codon:yes stop_codon:yes gene_type:complete